MVIHNLENIYDVAVAVFMNFKAQPKLFVQTNAKLSQAISKKFFGMKTFCRVENAFVWRINNDLHNCLKAFVHIFW